MAKPAELRVEVERDADGRWLAEVVNIPDLGGVLAYGADSEAAVRAAKALALRVPADLVEHDDLPADAGTVHVPREI